MTRGKRIAGKRRLVGFGGFALSAVLAVFHGRLLWQRLTDGSLLEPMVVARWVVSALLVLALLQLWSRGLPLLRGRRAGVLWLIVVLVHAMAPGGSVPAIGPIGAEGMLPVALAMLLLLAFGVAVSPRAAAPPALPPFHPRRRRSRRHGAGWHRTLFSRPPPPALSS